MGYRERYMKLGSKEKIEEAANKDILFCVFLNMPISARIIREIADEVIKERFEVKE